MSEIITQLEKATPFQLWRLKALIERLLNDPNKLLEVRRKLHIGQNITYFELEENREVSAIILKILRTHVLVKNTHDGEEWKLSLYMLNIEGLPTDVAGKKQKVNRLTLKVGEKVGFINHKQDNKLLCGIVTKLNTKTASVKLLTGEMWRVSYGALFYVLDVELEN